MTTPALLALVGTGLMTLVRTLRTDRVQAVLPEAIKWHNLPLQWQLGIVFGLGIGGSVATAASMGEPILDAAIAGFVAGATAMGLNTGTAKVGKAMTASAMAKNPQYVPSALRDVISIALPIDRKLLNGHAVKSSNPQEWTHGSSSETSEAKNQAQDPTD